MEISCQRRLITSPVLEEDVENVRISPWDSQEIIRMRVLEKTDDLPVSARWVSRTTYYSLRHTILRNQDAGIVRLYQQVAAFDFPEGSVGWTPLEFLFVYLDAFSGSSIISLRPDIQEWFGLVDLDIDTRRSILQDIVAWYDNHAEEWRNRFLGHVRRVEPLLTFGGQGERPPPRLLDTQKNIVYDYRMPKPVSCASLFQRISITQWHPTLGWALAAIREKSGSTRVQVSPDKTPFPDHSIISSEFFPWQDKDDNETIIYLFHSAFGWASVAVIGREIVRLTILENSQPYLLDAWEGMLSDTMPRELRTETDVGATFQFSISADDSFSWLRFYNLLINDAVFQLFMTCKPAPLTFQLPNPGKPRMTAVPQHLDLQWTMYAAGLWNLDAGLSFRVSVHVRTDPVFSYEIAFQMLSPVPMSSVDDMTAFMQDLISYVCRNSDDAYAGLDSIDRNLRKTLEKTYREWLEKHHVLMTETDLTKIFPRVFITPFYKSLCQLPLQPKIAEGDQVMEMPEDRRLLFPPKPMHHIEPTWYVCPTTKFPYPGLKKNTIEDAVFPLVPCCFEKPQHKNNQDKLLKMMMGIDIVSTKYKDNIIQKHHIIRNPSQLGILPPDLKTFFLSNYPSEQVYRVGMNWTPYSFLECLQYVQLDGKSMPIAQWYPAHLTNLLYKHAGLFSSCTPFHSVEDMIYQIRYPSKTFWVDPRIFLYFFEHIYQIRIFVWVQSGNGHVLLRSNRPLTNPPTRCVFIIQHYGGRMDRLTGKHYPQCELIQGAPLFDVAVPRFSPYFQIIHKLRIVSAHPILDESLFTHQAVFFTGHVMALRTRILTLWIEPPSIPAFDLDFWDPCTNPIARISSTDILRGEFERLGASVDPTLSRYRPPGGRAVLIWKLTIRGVHMLCITEDIPRHGLDEVIGGRADAVAIDTPPLWIKHALIRQDVGTPGLMDAMTPLAMIRNYDMMHMIRDVVVYRFLQWFQSHQIRAFDTIPWNEKLDEFFRRYTILSPDHYLKNPGFFPRILPTTYEDALALCCVDEKIVLPSPSVRSRLFYTIQWMLFYRKGMDHLLPTDERPSAFSFHGQWQNTDPRIMVMPYHVFSTIHT